MRIVFVEGIPGSGKSTMAEKLCAYAVNSGRDARWYLEESHDHPVHPKPWRTSKSQDDFAETCLRSWSNFVEGWKDQDTLHILEGSTFQSTVRFMMENRLSGIDSYFRRFEEIVSPLAPRMVYLRPADATAHSKSVCASRGNEWRMKVSEYLALTEYSAHHELSGLEGMHRFWNDYAQLCDMLVEQTSIPTRTIRFVRGEWERHLTEAVTFLGLQGADHLSVKPRGATKVIADNGGSTFPERFSMPNEDLVFYVKLYVKPDRVEEWKTAVTVVIEEMSREVTFISCHLHQDAHDENLFTLYERWSEPSVEAFLKNQMKPYRIAYEAKLESLLLRPREPQVLKTLGQWYKRGAES